MEVVEDSEKSDEITTPTDPNVSLFAYLPVVLQNLSIYSHTSGLPGYFQFTEVNQCNNKNFNLL